MDYELEELLENGTEDEIGEYCMLYHKELWNKKGKFFDINNKKLYAIYEDSMIIGWEWD